MIRERLKASIRAAAENIFSALDPGHIQFEIEYPGRPELGDFACNLPMKLSSLSGRPAGDLAAQIVERLSLQSDWLAAAEISAPAFINLRLTKEGLQSILHAIHKRDVYKGSGRANSESLLMALAKRLEAEPSFFLQHTYARTCSRLRQYIQAQLNIEKQCEEAPAVSAQEWQNWQAEYCKNESCFRPLFSKDEGETFEQHKRLILELDRLEELLFDTEPNAERLASCIITLSNLCNNRAPFGPENGSNKDFIAAHLGLLLACKKALHAVLKACDIEVKEKL